MKLKKKEKQVSIADFILFTLLLTGILSVIFRPYIQRFIGEIDKVSCEYTFIIENVSDSAMNYPSENEKMYSLTDGTYIGTIDSIIEKSENYESEFGEKISLCTLQCQANGEAEKKESGYYMGSVAVKAGAQIKVKTETSSFLMTVLSVKTQTK